ncbi:gluconate 2-dehydrogenase subunit 3 family protein [Aestuariivivens insulae]|uniref:gluconate 2-dehydrogenase subunit 3 family protein n=1 Tax=Aestuariivivens insulae TaxID=1621988 RepID=UPI001F598507|nr:gluconate 2-dehydrogenase subunit 3 family protein [Aestuariivivens insulae]
MKRREALKNIGLTSAFFVATPSVISLLQSCSNDVKSWTPEFLSEQEGVVLTNLVDIILPKTENLPSALELNIPQFIDKYMNEVFEDEDQGQYKTGFNNIIGLLRPNPEDDIKKITPDSYKALLDKHMLIKGEVDEERASNPESLDLTTSEFLNSIKWMAINAYKTTEEVGEKVLAYDPVPGAYYCGNLQELTGGKSWSL